MAAVQKKKQTFSQWLGLMKLKLCSLASLLMASLFGPFRSKLYPRFYKQHVTFSFLRALLDPATAEQMQSLYASSSEVYADFIKRTGATYRVETCPRGGKAFWLGASNPSLVIYYLHGGGYVTPLIPQHLELLSDLIDTLQRDHGVSIGALCLDYTLAPEGQYPTQLREASLMLSHLVQGLSFPPSQIVIAGDSAGANLALGLLLHLARSHPDIPPVSIHEPLGGALLISPWVTFNQSARSFSTNRWKDMFTSRTLRTMSDAFLGEQRSTPYNEPLLASSDWWRTVNVTNTHLLAGTDELFLDDIKAFGKVLGNEMPGKVTMTVSEDAPHVPPLVDYMLGIGKGGEQPRRIATWVASIA